ncbi:MAG: hypothetical protein AAB215_08590 [Planctomycetota bacterium]
MNFADGTFERFARYRGVLIIDAGKSVDLGVEPCGTDKVRARVPPAELPRIRRNFRQSLRGQRIICDDFPVSIGRGNGGRHRRTSALFRFCRFHGSSYIEKPSLHPCREPDSRKAEDVHTGGFLAAAMNFAMVFALP